MRRVRRALGKINDEYDWAILDCPPGISLASEIIVGVSDVLLVPVIRARYLDKEPLRPPGLALDRARLLASRPGAVDQ